MPKNISTSIALVDKHEVARMLSISVRTVEAWAQRGELPQVRVGANLRFDPRAIEASVAERTSGGGGTGTGKPTPRPVEVQS